MSGDFGEIITYFHHAASEHEKVAFGPKKWRLKETRTKPAPYSDVVQFVLPDWPEAGTDDAIFCSEVKAKATKNQVSPIEAAIAGCEKDRLSRLAKTLEWLKDRAIGEDFGLVELAHIERFRRATDYPTATKRFFAVAVIASNLVNDEIAKGFPAHEPNDYTVIILSVPQLRNIYTAVFGAARTSADHM